MYLFIYYLFLVASRRRNFTIASYYVLQTKIPERSPFKACGVSILHTLPNRERSSQDKMVLHQGILH